MGGVGIIHGGGGRGWVRGGRFAQFRASRHKLLDEEVHGDEAELGVASACARTVGDDDKLDGGDNRHSWRRGRSLLSAPPSKRGLHWNREEVQADQLDTKVELGMEFLAGDWRWNDGDRTD